MNRIRETRRILQAADRRRYQALDSLDFDPVAYDKATADLRRARNAHRAALAWKESE